MSSLDPINEGVLEGLTQYEVKANYPHHVEAWRKNPYLFRFPKANSQQDCAFRLVPLVMELERQVFPCAVISHPSTLQVLYGYFLGSETTPAHFCELSLPRHTIIELWPTQYGWQETRYNLQDLKDQDEQPVSSDLGSKDVKAGKTVAEVKAQLDVRTQLLKDLQVCLFLFFVVVLLRDIWSF